MSEYQTLEFTKNGKVARLAMNRPKAANGLNMQMGEELRAAAVACDRDPDIRVVIITGNGTFFSAGGDVKAMASSDEPTGQYLKRLADNLHAAISTFERMDKLVVVAVNGIAAGAGFSLALTGDLVIAADSASFTMAYTKVGLAPDGSSSYYLPRLVGVGRAKQLMLTNRTLTAAEALDWGMISQVVTVDELAATADKLASKLADGAKGSHMAVKQLLRSTFDNGLETQMELEGRAIAACSESADGQEGIAAFVEKRAPNFS